jgi:type IV fimbrial biogenesis protein FimT
LLEPVMRAAQGRPRRASGAYRARGLTLIELMVVIAITAILASLALPSFGRQMARTHLKSAAERVAADLSEARFESARRGVAMHAHFEPGAQWCYTVGTAPRCTCGAPQYCAVRIVHGSEHKGVSLLAAADLHFEPVQGTADAATAAELRAADGEELRVQMTRLGRAKICAPGGSTMNYPRC